MKKAIILIAACMLLFSGCERKTEVSTESSKPEVLSESSKPEVPNVSSKPEILTENSGEVKDVREVIYKVENGRDDIYAGPIEFPLEPEWAGLPSCMQPIASEEEAREMGQEMLEAFWEKGRFPDFALWGIIHFTKINVWRFEYSNTIMDTDEAMGRLGSVLYVAIDGSTGDIVQIWIEE